jgi:alpha-amylase/alpha-mannosidase (GH57 family)
VGRVYITCNDCGAILEQMTALIIHGHFYQPPRENPWTGEVDEEPSAAPFHDWNERVHAECYQPNTAVRVVGNTGEEHFVNNYELLSFDFGPTLLTWLERQHPAAYEQIIAADAESVRRRGGHGNAIAQAYGHAILPLCNEHDQRTQVRWGVADFRLRYKREPESLWLPETACNNNVLDLLIDEGLRFVILAPQQAQRVRKSSTGIPACPDTSEADEEWFNVSSGKIDTSLAYRYFHRDKSARSIAVFFYDPALAQAIAFEQALSSSSSLVDRFAQAAGQDGQLVNVATDGESYGHHHKFGELCLAHALEIDAPARGFRITNYGEYLDEHPAIAEVEINEGVEGKGTSWSCAHGVSRWSSDCGCHTGGEAGWNQAWRAPLRKALDYLRDAAAVHFEATRGELFVDPWSARDASIELLLDQTKSREAFVANHAPRPLAPKEPQRALVYLEMQRNLLLMYASCGWFFNDIAGIEPLQIMKYAARAMELMDQLGLPSPRRQFLEILSDAQSNQTEMGNGADIYRRLVEPSNPAFKENVDEPARTFA